jgi:hypothetical protein
MKSEKEIRDRLEKINLILSPEMEVYIPNIKKIELRRERWFLEEILEVKHETN